MTLAPFAALTKRFDIFSSEETIDQLAEECAEIAKGWDVPLDVIVELPGEGIDTVVSAFTFSLAEGAGAAANERVVRKTAKYCMQCTPGKFQKRKCGRNPFPGRKAAWVQTSG